MSAILRLFWILTLTCFLTGCTAYRRAALPGAGLPEPEPRETVRPGMTVKVVLRSGENVSGEVVAVSASSLTLGGPSNYGWQERTIPAGDILVLEAERSTKLGSILAATVGTTMLVAAVAIVALAIAFSGSDLGGLS